MFTVVVRPRARGKFQAWIEGEEDEVFVSSTPLCDGARRLLRRGEDPSGVLAMRHENQSTISLWGCVGVVGELTVHEAKTPRFVPWRAFPRAAVSLAVPKKAPAGVGVPQIHI